MSSRPPAGAAVAEGAAVPAPRRKVRSLESSNARFAYYMLAPALLCMALVAFYPMVNTIVTSLTDSTFGQNSTRFVGLDNYRALLLDDPVFRQVLFNTSTYVLGTVPVRTALALLLAIALNQQLRGASVFRAAYFLPTITSAVAAATVWRWIYEPNFGLLNSLLYAIGVQHPPTWLSSPAWAMPALTRSRIRALAHWASAANPVPLLSPCGVG